MDFIGRFPDLVLFCDLSGVLNFVFWLVVFCFLAGTGAVVFVAFFVWRVVHRLLEQRRRRDLEILAAQHRRLSWVVGNLLACVDTLDQEATYDPDRLDDSAGERFGRVCADLVVLSDGLPVIKRLLKDRKTKQARSFILKSVRVADHLSCEISRFRKRQKKRISSGEDRAAGEDDGSPGVR